jgi:hypothetical protein
VVWQIQPKNRRVRLLRQYGSKDMDPRFARPRTVAQVAALMTARDELPPTDTVSSVATAGAPDSAIRALVSWLMRLVATLAGQP